MARFTMSAVSSSTTPVRNDTATEKQRSPSSNPPLHCACIHSFARAVSLPLSCVCAGGPEILTNEGGTDATAKFEEVFHSDDARKQLKDFCVGTLEGYTGPPDAALKKKGKAAGAQEQAGSANGVNPAVYLLAVAGVAALVYLFVL